MSYITCTNDCVYQSDGVCDLKYAASPTEPQPSSVLSAQAEEGRTRPNKDCVHYISKERPK